MEKIQQKYNFHKNKKSDINEHLPTLFELSKECDHITEMGVRHVVSTWAFLLAQPKKLISYDIVYHPNIDEVKNLSKEYNLDFTFIKDDSLKCQIEKTDFLFIDTLHCYNQLYEELHLHSKNVNKYIGLHDTESFGLRDEKIYGHASDLVKSKQKKKQGLRNAYQDFLNENNEWQVHKIYRNNNGLTILKRV